MKIYLVCLSVLLCILVTGCVIPQSHLHRGKYYLKKNQPEKAIRELENASREEGDLYYYIDVYSSLGDSYAMNGEPEKAVSVYRNALQMIHLRTRQISAQRLEARRSLNAASNTEVGPIQEQDMRLADEEWQLHEMAEDLKSRIKGAAIPPP